MYRIDEWFPGIGFVGDDVGEIARSKYALCFLMIEPVYRRKRIDGVIIPNTVFRVLPHYTMVPDMVSVQYVAE